MHCVAAETAIQSLTHGGNYHIEQTFGLMLKSCRLDMDTTLWLMFWSETMTCYDASALVKTYRASVWDARLARIWIEIGGEVCCADLLTLFRTKLNLGGETVK